MIPDQLKKELEQRVATAVTPREAAVAVMKELQAHYGWLTDEAVSEAAELLGLSTALQVEELATFYEMIYRRPVGKRVVHVCDSISCWAMGGESLLAATCSPPGHCRWGDYRRRHVHAVCPVVVWEIAENHRR